MRHFLAVARTLLSTIALSAAIDSRLFTAQAAASTASVVNMSTRGLVGTGSNAMVAGFVIGPGTGDTILIRAVGPGLGAAPFNIPGVLPDPVLTLFNSSGVVLATNRSWGTSTGASAALMASVGAFPLAAGSTDSALVVSLPAGSYTAQVTGAGGDSGVILLEAYVVGASATSSPMLNFSTRLQVGTGSNIATSGLYVSGTGGTRTLLIRAVGPTLSTLGMTGVLADPNMIVLDASHAVLAGNDDWETPAGPGAATAAALAAAFTQSYAFALPAGSKDSALITSLPPGGYTIQVTGNGATTGVALVEVYDITPAAETTATVATTAAPATSTSTATVPAASASTAANSALPPTLSVAATVPTATLDGNETGLITFSLSAPAPANLTVNFSLGGTAAKWTDYFRLPQGDMPVAVTIPAGASSATLPITARANSTGANSETVVFTLLADPSYTVGTADSATLTILPTVPAAPVVNVIATSATASLDGSNVGLITFSLSVPAPANLTVNFSLGGTAAKWTDYFRLPQGDMPVAVTVPAGASSATLPITARANSTGANPETVVFTLLADPSYIVGAANTVTLTIPPPPPVLPTVSVAATVPTATLDGNETGLITFSLSVPAPANMTVNFSLGGTAAKWTDYYRLPQGDMPVAVTIPAGASSATLPITARANSTGANPETVIFTLSADPSYIVGAANTVTLTIPPPPPVLPTVSVAATVPTATLDGNETGLITFSLSVPAPANMTVNFSLGGTAAKWTDYYRLPQGDMPVAVTIPAGASSATLPITARANSTGANPETVVLTLLADPSYIVGTANAATLAIVSSVSTGTASTGGGSTTTPPPATPPPVVSTGGSGSTGGGGPTGVIEGTSGSDSANRTADTIASGDNVDDTALQLPAVGDHLLHVLSPSILELVSINTKQPDPAPVTNWNFVNSSGQASEPSPSKFAVTVNGQAVPVLAVGFKRRALYAPLQSYDLRVENSLYLQIAAPIADGQLVSVANPDGSIWPASTQFTALAGSQRYSPAIHVNEEGYVPAFAKQAMVGYYLGDMGEMPVNPGAGFNIIDAGTGAVVFTGSLTLRQDSGYQTSPLPYQQVYVADFSTFTAPGQYQVQVPGIGASLPFLIDDGIAMAWTRTYALGMYEQRSGIAVSLPFTRFTHAADHTAPASVPVPDTSPQFAFTWNCVSGYATTVNTANPKQIAPFLTSNETSLYPFVNTGAIDVSGGHFDAGDYSKYTLNSAQLVHELVFAVDNIPGLQSFDNLGIPESGDGIPDVLQEAKWEADFLAKMQDADGGFYFLVYPIGREYESNVLPENGDPQVVWPKNTSATAASVAALAEAGSSPVMIKFYPQAAAKYLQEARLGWQFLANAIARHGLAGSYQKITFYGDDWTHNDELAWAASAMYAATGEAQYQTQLFQWFPNPADSATFRWGWWQMSECWGNAIRTYAFAARSGRLPSSALDPSYLAACNGQIVAAGDAAVTWGGQCAYGTPFPPATKAVQGGGWYFSLDQASDMAVAYQVDPKPAYIDGLVAAMNYEGGCNPVNVSYLEGLGLKRQQQTVSQYAQNSRRVLSPTGDTLGQVTAGFEYLNSYGSELYELSYPSDSGNTNTYPYYDRWSDAYNVTTEQITVNQARSLISAGFLASLTNSASTAWTAPQATISLPASPVPLNAPVTLSVQVSGQSLANARIVWEARDQKPAYGTSYTISPVNNGDQWVEAEVEWPDGRRAFAAGDFQANSASQVWIDDSLPANAVPGADGGDTWNWISGNPAPHTGSLAFQSGILSGEHDLNFTGATGGMNDDLSTIGHSGSMQVGKGDTLFAWVYIDPANLPTELMLCWYDGSSYAHRAYWGANSISWGNNGTASQYRIGALPAAGQWVELSVPASAVGLEGDTVSGMTFAAFGGRVSWDTIGRASAGQ